jgi:hypothetical protein
MEIRLRNAPNNKRVFGKDITNLDRRSKANSISEKNTQIIENRQKSRSFDKKIVQEVRDPINDHEPDIISFMLTLQVTMNSSRKKRRERL